MKNITKSQPKMSINSMPGGKFHSLGKAHSHPAKQRNPRMLTKYDQSFLQIGEEG